MHNPKNDSYDHWVNNRKRLLKENENLKFDIDSSLFYKDFFYKVAMYCKNAVSSGNILVIRKILKDEFYKQNIKYISALPVHIRIVHRCAAIYPELAIVLLRVWNNFTKNFL